jgi:hypothetical protein
MKKSLLEFVRSESGRRKPGPTSWISRLPEALAADVLEAKRAWRAGEIDGSARQTARSIINYCQQNGVPSCSIDHLRVWLAEN